MRTEWRANAGNKLKNNNTRQSLSTNGQLTNSHQLDSTDNLCSYCFQLDLEKKGGNGSNLSKSNKAGIFLLSFLQTDHKYV